MNGRKNRSGTDMIEETTDGPPGLNWHLMRVCKDWYSIAIELLYEDIRPASTGGMYNLLDLLLRKENATEVGLVPDDTRGPVFRTRRLGWWTKIFYAPHDRPGGRAEFFIDRLVGLVPRFPNLTVFANPAGYLESRRDHDCLARAFHVCNNLQYPLLNHWKNHRPRRETVTAAYLSSSSSLRYLKTVWSQENFSMALPIYHIHLKTLTLSLAHSSNLERFDALRLPSLRCISIYGEDALYTTPGFQRFFDIHGPQITSLASEVAVHTLLEGTDSIIARCTSLHELLLLMQIGPTHLGDAPATSLYPSVVRLGIRMSKSLEEDTSFSHTWSWFPNL